MLMHSVPCDVCWAGTEPDHSVDTLLAALVAREDTIAATGSAALVAQLLTSFAVNPMVHQSTERWAVLIKFCSHLLLRHW